MTLCKVTPTQFLSHLQYTRDRAVHDGQESSVSRANGMMYKIYDALVVNAIRWCALFDVIYLGSFRIKNEFIATEFVTNRKHATRSSCMLSILDGSELKSTWVEEGNRSENGSCKQDGS